jgi:hypothetical protein
MLADNHDDDKAPDIAVPADPLIVGLVGEFFADSHAILSHR